VATPFAQQLAAQGGAPPYTWSVPAGSAAPPGLALQTGGLLQGTPSVPGNFAFFVVVSDSAGASVQLALTMSVIPATNPVPSLVTISPTTAVQGSPDMVVTLSGADIAPNAIVLWDGVPLPSTYLSPTQIAASIPTLDLATDGSHQVSITNPAPGGGTSAPVTFTVTPGPVNPVPTLVAIQPAQLVTSSIDTQITVTGSSFIASSSVLVGSQPIATTEVSASQLSAVVPAAFLSGTGALPIAVLNPPPGGGVSSVISVGVGTLVPLPVIQVLAPSSAVAGSATLPLAIQGTGFLSGAQAFFGSVALATTVTSATAITATVPQGLLANAGNVNVVVVDPGGLVSAAATFAVTGPGDDAGSDAGVDAGSDAGVDAGSDAGVDAGSDAGVDAMLDGSDDGAASDADATVSNDDGSAADGSVDDAAAGDASGSGPPPGTLGGPCLDIGAPGFPCDNDPTLSCDQNVCLLTSGALCGTSSQCAFGMSCVLGLCNQYICASVVTNSTGNCSVPGGNGGVGQGATLSTCAPGYICQESLTGQWQFLTPLCAPAGGQSPCIPQDIPAGQPCDFPPMNSSTTHACMPGLTCSVNPDGAPPLGSGLCE
jgi:hypothetical protein